MRNLLLIGILLIVSTFLVISCKSPLSANSESSTTNETWSEDWTVFGFAFGLISYLIKKEKIFGCTLYLKM